MSRVLYLLSCSHLSAQLIYTYTSITALAPFVCYHNNLHPLPQVLLQKKGSDLMISVGVKERPHIYQGNFSIVV